MSQEESLNSDDETIVKLSSQDDLLGHRLSVRAVEHEYAVILENRAIASGPFTEETRPTLSVAETIISTLLEGIWLKYRLRKHVLKFKSTPFKVNFWATSGESLPDSSEFTQSVSTADDHQVNAEFELQLRINHEDFDSVLHFWDANPESASITKYQIAQKFKTDIFSKVIVPVLKETKSEELGTEKSISDLKTKCETALAQPLSDYGLIFHDFTALFSKTEEEEDRSKEKQLQSQQRQKAIELEIQKQEALTLIEIENAKLAATGEARKSAPVTFITRPSKLTIATTIISALLVIAISVFRVPELLTRFGVIDDPSAKELTENWMYSSNVSDIRSAIAKDPIEALNQILATASLSEGNNTQAAIKIIEIAKEDPIAFANLLKSASDSNSTALAQLILEANIRDSEKVAEGIWRAAEIDSKSTANLVVGLANADSNAAGDIFISSYKQAGNDTSHIGELLAKSAEKDQGAISSMIVSTSINNPEDTAAVILATAKANIITSGKLIANAANQDPSAIGTTLTETSKQDPQATGNLIGKSAISNPISTGNAIAASASQNYIAIGESLTTAIVAQPTKVSQAISQSAKSDKESIRKALNHKTSENSDAISKLGEFIPTDSWTIEIPPLNGRDKDKWADSTIVGLPDSPIEQVSVKFNDENKQSNISLSTGTPALPEGYAHRHGRITYGDYIEISPDEFSDKDTQSNHVEFKVSKIWLEENQIHEWSIQFSRFNEDLNNWQPVTAKYVREDDSYNYYTAPISGFSSWSITGGTEIPKPSLEFFNFLISEDGSRATIEVMNKGDYDLEKNLSVWVGSPGIPGSKVIQTKSLIIGENNSETIAFELDLPPGNHIVRIENQMVEKKVLPHQNGSSLSPQQFPSPTPTDPPTPESGKGFESFQPTPSTGQMPTALPTIAINKKITPVPTKIIPTPTELPTPTPTRLPTRIPTATPIPTNTATHTPTVTPIVYKTETKGHINVTWNGNSIANNGFINSAQYQDWTFNGMQSNIISILMSSSNMGIDPVITLYDQQGSEEQYNDDYGMTFDAGIINWPLQTSGLYTIRVATGGLDSGDYQLTVTGNTMPTPTITVTPSPTLTVTPTPIKTATPTVTLTPTITGTPTPTPTGTLTPVPTPTITPIPTLTPTPTKTPIPTPTLTPTPVASPDDEGGQITAGSWQTADLNVVGDTDEWYFSGTSNHMLNITVQATGSSTVDPYIKLRSPQGLNVNVDFPDGDGVAEIQAHVLAQTGTYSIITGGANSGSYRLKLEMTAPTPTPTPTPTLTPIPTATPTATVTPIQATSTPDGGAASYGSINSVTFDKTSVLSGWSSAGWEAGTHKVVMTCDYHGQLSGSGLKIVMTNTNTGDTSTFSESQQSPCYDSVWFADVGTYTWTEASIAINANGNRIKHYYPDGSMKDNENNPMGTHQLNIPDIIVVNQFTPTPTPTPTPIPWAYGKSSYSLIESVNIDPTSGISNTYIYITCETSGPAWGHIKMATEVNGTEQIVFEDTSDPVCKSVAIQPLAPGVHEWKWITIKRKSESYTATYSRDGTIKDFLGNVVDTHNLSIPNFTISNIANVTVEDQNDTYKIEWDRSSIPSNYRIEVAVLEKSSNSASLCSNSANTNNTWNINEGASSYNFPKSYFKTTGQENPYVQFCVRWASNVDGPWDNGASSGVLARDTSASVVVSGPWAVTEHDSQRTGLTDKVGIIPGAEAWSVSMPNQSRIMKEPSIGSDGTLYVGGKRGRVKAISENGDEKWTHIPSWDKESETYGTVVTSNAIYAALNASPYSDPSVRKLSLTDGSVIKETSFSCDNSNCTGEIYYPMLPTSGGYLVVPIKRHLDQSSAVALNRNLEEVWKFEFPEDPNSGNNHILLTEALDGAVVAQVGDYVYSIDGITGTEKWRSNILPLIGRIPLFPTIAPDGKIIIATKNSVIGLYPANGNLATTYYNGSIEEGISLVPDSLGDGTPGSGGMVFIDADNNFVWLDGDGEDWTIDAGDTAFEGGLTVDADGKVYLPQENNGVIKTFDLSTKTVFNYGGGCDNGRGISIGSDGSLYWACGEGKVYKIIASDPVSAPAPISLPITTGHPWGMAGHDPQKTRLSTYKEGDTDLIEKWQLNVSDTVQEEPSIGSDGTIYVGNNRSQIIAVNPDTGSEKWKYEDTAQPNGTVFGVALTQNHLFAGFGQTSRFGKFNQSNGNLIQMVQIAPAVTIQDPLLIHNDTVYIPGRAHSDVSNFTTRNGSLLAYTTDLQFKWRHDFKTGAESPGQEVRPAVGLDGTIFVQVSDYLYAINTDGTERWMKNLQTMEYSPTIGHDGTVYVPAGASIIALDPADGSTKWEFTLSDHPASGIALGPDSLGDGTKGSGGLFFSVASSLTWLSSDGNTSWEYYLGDTAGPGSISVGSDGTVYYPQRNDGSLIAINPVTRTESWRFTPPVVGGLPAGVAIGPDGSIYLPVDGKSGTPPRLYALASNFSNLQLSLENNDQELRVDWDRNSNSYEAELIVWGRNSDSTGNCSQLDNWHTTKNAEFADAYVMDLSTTLPDTTPPYLQICARWSNSGHQGDWITTSPIKTPAPTSVDGRLVYVSSRDGNDEIFIGNANGTNEQQLTFTESPVRNLAPVISPDGNRIAFTGTVAITETNQQFTDLFVMDVDGSNVSNVTNQQFRNIAAHLSWVFGQDRILFSTNLTGDNQDIYSILTDGTMGTRLTTTGHNIYPSGWASDTTPILYVSDDFLYTMHLSGTDKTRVDENTGNLLAHHMEYPRWSPDASKITFSYHTRGNSTDFPCSGVCSSAEVYVANYYSSNQTIGNITQLTFSIGSRSARWPSFSSDGEYVFYTRTGPNNIYAVKADGTGIPTRVFSTHGSAIQSEYSTWGPNPSKMVSYADGPEVASYSVSSMGCTKIQDVAFDGTNLWMLCGLDGQASLFKLNPTTAEKIAEYPMANEYMPEPNIMNYGGGRLWITNSNGGLRIFNIGTEIIENQPSPGGTIYNAIFDGENVWALHANSTGNIVTTAGFTLNSICDGWCEGLVTDENFVYVSDSTGSGPRLWKLRKSDGAILETYTSGDFQSSGGVGDLMYDGSRIWSNGLATDGTFYWIAGNTTLSKRLLD